jgi:cytochrome c-type biogenesis protein CcmH
VKKWTALYLGAFVLMMVVPDESQSQADSTTRRFVPVTAADSAIERMTTVLASELRCPVCQGNSIQDSPSELALQMRDVIRDQLRAGKTPDEVRAYFVDKYGEWILLSPKAEGLNLVVYIIPLLAVLAGGLVVWRTVRRWTGGVPPNSPDTPRPGA